ncbi:MAG: molecular chaperone DjlA [Flavobacteriales bacterium]|nr:molecular chaperone DjlA [Flavobacteriales bacterium]
MNDYAKWVGGGLGWMWGGPIGAFVGYQLGKYIGKNFQSKETSFEISLLILSAMVVKVDGKIKKEELDCVRAFFIQSFGKLKSDQYFHVFNEVKHKKFPSVRSVCLEVNKHVTHKTRLQIIHFLFSIANSDRHIDAKEIDIIKKISKYFWISEYDFSSIEAMFSNKKNINNAYDILGVPKSSSDDEIKKAYRKMIKKYHPDKLKDVSDDIIQMAKQKFQSVKDAYEYIRKQRGF